MNRFLILFISAFIVTSVQSQVLTSGGMPDFSYSTPKTYEIGGITIEGAEYFDHRALKLISGLKVGDEIKVPGEEITDAVRKLWDQQLFSNVEIIASRTEGRTIFLTFRVESRPRLSKFSIKGVRKGHANDLRDEIKLIRGKIITDNLLINTENIIKDFFVDKGFYNCEVNITERPDSTVNNSVDLIIDVKKNERVKIKDITFSGNESISTSKLRGKMKSTKKKNFNIFVSSKFIENGFEEDKNNLVSKYNAEGFRDAKIVRDTVTWVGKRRVKIHIDVSEGYKYYFRDIKWVGNTKYTSKALSKILGIEKGDVFNQQLLEERLQQDRNGRDISSLYLDDGYLFFNVTPVEVLVEDDSIDFEIRIYEGKQATVNRVTVVGNTKTNDRVIMREIRTKPGTLFSRSDIIRTHRELAQLGYFDPEKANQNIEPHQEDGTVDIEYIVEEKPSDQIELSGGWGGGRIVGSLGVSFNNFSARNFFKKDAWSPLPSGDGQRLSLRAQTNGPTFQQYSISFTEPWLGGKKRNSLTISLYNQVSTNGEKKYVTNDLGIRTRNPNRSALNIYGLSVGLGKQLQWPDDYFNWYNEVSYQYYVLENYFSQFIFSNGEANNLSFKSVISRNSIDAPIYPRRGSQISLGVQFTPPYSLFDEVEDYGELTFNDRYQWIEYHKWTYKMAFYNNLTKNLVFHTKIGYGFLGHYNDDLGQSPFERFYLGGDGLSGFALDGREIVALRGFGNGDLSASTGDAILAKYTMELRYPLTLNPTATIYVLSFAEAGNSWGTFSAFSPFEVYRSVGFGVRIFMPMFGLLGLDWGYRLDDIPGVSNPNKRTELHFTIGGNIGGW